ncbi:hypothetical protein D3C84_488300 [compost metagenome]
MQQTGCATQNFHAIEEDHVLRGPVAQRIGVARNRHAVVLPVIDLETARAEDQAPANALGPDQAGGLVGRILEIDNVLIVHLLAGYHRDRLRNFLEGVSAFADGHCPCGIGTRAFGRGVGAAFNDVGDTQLQCRAALRGRFNAEVALIRHA